MNIIFGDSFIGPFSLLNDDKLIVKKFKGKTMRGISKINSDDYNILINILNKQKEINGINYVLFMFGQVDIVFSIYYEILIKNNYNIKQYLEDTSKSFCNFLLSLNNIMNNKKIIGSICPLMLNDEESFHSLYLYPVIDMDILNNIPMNLKNIIFSYEFRNSCRLYLNYLNKQFCKKFNMKFIDFDSNLINKINNKPFDYLKVKESDYNIHPYFEIVLFKYLAKLKFMNLNIKFNEDLELSKNKYCNDKKKLMNERLNEIKLLNYNNNIIDNNIDCICNNFIMQISNIKSIINN